MSIQNIQPEDRAWWKRVLAMAYFVIATASWFGILYRGFFVIRSGEEAIKKWTSTVLPATLLLFVPAMIIAFSVFAFPIKYSLFGTRKRTLFPEEAPIKEERHTWGRVGFFYASIPFFRWTVFPSGLGIVAIGIGRAFIPIKEIVTLRTCSSGGYELLHSSPELRNPVILPSKRIFESLQSLAGAGQDSCHSR